MKRYVFLCWAVFGLAVAFLQAQESFIHIVYPKEDQWISSVDSTFIFGSVTPGASLLINETSVPTLSNGAFLAYLPVQTGTFIFDCVAVQVTDTVQVRRRVFISRSLKAYPVDSLGFDASRVDPTVDYTLLPGDLLEVSVKGTPGCQASFDIEGVAWDVPMTESMPLPRFPWGEAVFGDMKSDTTYLQGVYTGLYQIQGWDAARDAGITFHLTNRVDTVSWAAKGHLTVAPAAVPTMAVLTEETVIARPSPGHAYTWFLPKGVKLWLTGQKGVWHRARLAEGHEAWVPEGSFALLPRGTHIPKAIVRYIRTARLDDRVRVSIPLEERLPFHVRQRVNPASLIVTLYGAWSDTDWIPQDFSDPVIRDLIWRQVSNGVYEVEIFLNQTQQWGYDARYDDAGFTMEIKRAPKIHRSVFKDITICLDPGHHPEPGAVGPTGLEEREVNLGVALELRTMLEDKGAVVIMTRESEEGIALYTRPKLAAAVDADLLISIHFNALPDGVNPWRNNGSSTYYFHPMGSRLARLIHEEVLRELKLPDFGVYYANLALCRPTQMPAVLTEEAFMMIPEQEALLRTHDFRRRCAKAIFKGLERFLKENR